MGWFRDKNGTRRLEKACDTVGRDCRLEGENHELKGRITLGDRCVLYGNVLLRTHRGGRIVLHDDVLVQDYAMMHSDGAIEVGSGTIIGPYAVLRDNNHLFQGTAMHWRRTPPIIRPITIGAHCFLGARSYVMPGVTIGDGAVVVPGSIVTRDIGPEEVWAGSPSAQYVLHRRGERPPTTLRRHLELAALYGFTPEGDALDTPVAATADDAGEDAP